MSIDFAPVLVFFTNTLALIAPPYPLGLVSQLKTLDERRLCLRSRGGRSLIGD
jgi:hypothetical protein